VDLAAECSFETPIEQREVIEEACRRLVQQVAAPLAARQEGAVQLECRLDCPPGEPVRATVGLFRPSASAKHLWEMLKLRLEPLRLSDAVTAVRLEVLARAPLAWQQQELFDADRRRNAARQTAMLIDRLSNRLGRQAVVRPVLLSDAQPEHACIDVPLAGDVATRVSRRTPQTRQAKRSRSGALSRRHTVTAGEDERPLCLKRQPLPLQVRQTHSGAPRAFRLAGREHRLTRVWGPERIETGWWRTGLVRRDYYRVETVAGSRYWLFHDLRSNRWFLHGEFA
jgi:protein ImuB